MPDCVLQALALSSKARNADCICARFAACSIDILRGVLLSWRYARGQVCNDDGHISGEAVHVWC